jgi:hypothetical protein
MQLSVILIPRLETPDGNVYKARRHSKSSADACRTARLDGRRMPGLAARQVSIECRGNDARERTAFFGYPDAIAFDLQTAIILQWP